MYPTLKDAKVGDKVEQEYNSGFSRRTRIATVTRTTATLIYVGDTAYLRSNGYERGSSGYRPLVIRAIGPENSKQVHERAHESEVSDARDFIAQASQKLTANGTLNVRDYIKTILGDKQ